jgi:diaminohydroxyphosphoribosylaminopyrimidine deaminase/5-amino-6-(5-phosphoribosylamino)uracil reductase
MDPQDISFMREALSLAEDSLGLASPNPPVGCVIVREGEVVGKGWHEYAARDHAEVRALAQAGRQAHGATVYVTLEPCSHFGRTPPCASALKEAGVRRAVVAHVDPNPNVRGSGIEWLRSAGITVDVGLLHDESARVIEPFACHVTTGLPLVVCKAGMSLDGRISTARDPGGRITSEAGCDFGQQQRLQLDALLVGVGTVLADNPRLTYRGALRKERLLLTVVLDSLLRTPADALLFRNASPPCVLIFCRADAPAERRRELEASGAEIVSVSQGPGGLDLNEVLRELGRRRILGLLVEGGSEVHWSFLSAELADKFLFIIAPVVLGGIQAVPCVGGIGYACAGAAPPFRISRHFFAGPDLILETFPKYSRSILSPWRCGER